jgi:hypothetical protein
MITLADIEMYGKVERHEYETYEEEEIKKYNLIGVKIDLSKDKWALLEVNAKEYTVSWRLFEKNWTLAKKPYVGPCSEGCVFNMHNGCYPMGIGTETAKRDLWEYCDDAERAVLIMNGLFFLDFGTPKD